MCLFVARARESVAAVQKNGFTGHKRGKATQFVVKVWMMLLHNGGGCGGGSARRTRHGSACSPQNFYSFLNSMQTHSMSCKQSAQSVSYQQAAQGGVAVNTASVADQSELRGTLLCMQF